MVCIIDQVFQVPFNTGRCFDQLKVGQGGNTRLQHPGFCQDFGVECRRLPMQFISLAAKPLLNPQVSRVERAVISQPCILVEIDSLNDEGLSLPVADRVTEVGVLNIITMCPAIGRDDPKKVTGYIVVKEYNLACRMHDLVGRPDPGDTRTTFAASGGSIMSMARTAAICCEVSPFPAIFLSTLSSSELPIFPSVSIAARLSS